MMHGPLVSALKTLIQQQPLLCTGTASNGPLSLAQASPMATIGFGASLRSRPTMYGPWELALAGRVSPCIGMGGHGASYPAQAPDRLTNSMPSQQSRRVIFGPLGTEISRNRSRNRY